MAVILICFVLVFGGGNYDVVSCTRSPSLKGKELPRGKEAYSPAKPPRYCRPVVSIMVVNLGALPCPALPCLAHNCVRIFLERGLFVWPFPRSTPAAMSGYL